MSILKKGNKLYGIFKMKCPRCHEGDLFRTKTLSFEGLTEMPEACEVCGQSYMPEPGFYYGAMFISYGITAFFSLAFVGICMLGFGMGVNASFLFLIIVCALLFRWFFRISRSIWIAIVIKYEGEKDQINEELKTK